ncbi:MAG: RpoL/Rpb11 RNA polymerase subunit family protein [Candidatus Nanoarchaeia archaeon]
MEIEILKEEKDFLELKFSEIDHGLLNMIKEALWKQSGVELASFRLDHPEISKPVFILRTKNKDAKKVWNLAIDSLSNELDKLDKEVKKLK